MEIIEKIYTAGLKLLEPLDAATLYKTIAHEAVKLVEGDEGRVLLRQNGDFQLVYAFPDIAKDTKSRKKGFAYKALVSKQAFIVDTSKHPNIHPELRERGVKSILFIPLSHKKESMGVLVVQSYVDKKFSQAELDILKLFGSFASLAIRKTQAFDEAQRALEIRDRFIPLAAHELRTPMTTISGYIQLLNSRMSKHDTQEGKWIRQLSIENKRLTNLISELLEVNRINVGKMEFILHECDLASIIRKAIEQFESVGVRQKFKFINHVEPEDDHLIADADKLFKALTSILDNSIKFSSAGSEINVKFKSTKSDLVLRITDQGTGINKKDLSKIFESFYKGEVDEQKGLGLGLFLAKSIIEKHKGDIVVRSKEKKGTVVEIRLPKVNL